MVIHEADTSANGCREAQNAAAATTERLRAPKLQIELPGDDHVDEDEESGVPVSTRSNLNFYGVGFMEDQEGEQQGVGNCRRTKSVISNMSVSSKSSRMSRMKRMVSGMSQKLGLKRPGSEFTGSWKCIETWGLDEFLKACKVSKMQLMAAGSAPWPSWQFEQDGNKFKFVNTGIMGVLEEKFVVDGPEFISIDGRKQKRTCKAFWQDHHLIIERSSPQGNLREDIHIDADGLLQFKLESIEEGNQASWGRIFQRA